MKQYFYGTFNTSLKLDLLQSNIPALKKYNFYAKANEMYTCPIPKSNKSISNYNDNYVPKCLRSVYEIKNENHEQIIDSAHEEDDEYSDR